MSTPHKCPVCDGYGERVAFQPVTYGAERKVSCRACSGSGIVCKCGWTNGVHEVSCPLAGSPNITSTTKTVVAGS